MEEITTWGSWGGTIYPAKTKEKKKKQSCADGILLAPRWRIVITGAAEERIQEIRRVCFYCWRNDRAAHSSVRTRSRITHLSAQLPVSMGQCRGWWSSFPLNVFSQPKTDKRDMPMGKQPIVVVVCRAHPAYGGVNWAQVFWVRASFNPPPTAIASQLGLFFIYNRLTPFPIKCTCPVCWSFRLLPGAHSTVGCHFLLLRWKTFNENRQAAISRQQMEWVASMRETASATAADVLTCFFY